MNSYLVEIPITGTRVVTIEADSKEEALEKLNKNEEEFIDIFDNINDFDVNSKDVKILEYDQDYFDKKYNNENQINY
ncbi:hypothetical protein BFS06_14160 [Clostridium perfringens]|uniref:Uncharacterized protein n=1 Tax=Clostridium perfringens TaxID=1502 RepID=A0A140GRI0_CLOPF|nr:hypothetical protein [Clostridium perfringens]AMN31139.1 hypothetical protein JFP838_pA0223 [Clostridium perfringens]TBX14350.1 hypothetical protein BFS06_14160 [Clostridium perfringens]